MITNKLTLNPIIFTAFAVNVLPIAVQIAIDFTLHFKFHYHLSVLVGCIVAWLYFIYFRRLACRLYDFKFPCDSYLTFTGVYTVTQIISQLAS